ncbi:MAG: type 1 periplasmic-binding domain-containing protein [Acidimicrobiales bacterium]
MTPLLEFRRWARRSPAAERLLTAGVAVGLLGLLAWALVPVGDSSRTDVAASGADTGTATGAATAGSAGGRVGPAAAGGAATPGGGAASGTVGAGASAGGAGGAADQVAAGGGGGVSAGATGSCGSLTSTDQGVTPTQIKIDIDVADLAGQAGNSLVGLPSAQTEEAIFQAAIDAVNASGGVRCRQLVAKYYRVNALDQPSLEAACLNMVADHPFALLDEGLGSPAGSHTPRDCPPSYKLPEFASLALSQSEIDQFSPYLFGDGATNEGIVNDWVLGAHQLGWFTGVKKIGLLEQDCVPDLNRLTLSDLAKIGIPASEITTFDFGCPNQIPPPNEVEQAVLQFKVAGVSHVMDDGGDYENYFSKDAQAQNYHPKYSVGDQGTIALWDNPNFGPDPANFSGALAITPTQYGAENTPGTVFNAQTKACDRAMAPKGLPSAERSPDGFSGVACTLVSMLVTAASRAPTLRRVDLAAGLRQAGHIDFTFPIGPGSFASFGGLHGGGYWRADTWVTSCSCFRVSTPMFAPSFP